MKRRIASAIGSAGKTAITSRSFSGATSPVPAPQITPTVSRLPSGTTTKCPGATAMPSGTR